MLLLLTFTVALLPVVLSLSLWEMDLTSASKLPLPASLFQKSCKEECSPAEPLTVPQPSLDYEAWRKKNVSMDPFHLPIGSTLSFSYFNSVQFRSVQFSSTQCQSSLRRMFKEWRIFIVTYVEMLVVRHALKFVFVSLCCVWGARVVHIFTNTFPWFFHHLAARFHAYISPKMSMYAWNS